MFQVHKCVPRNCPYSRNKIVTNEFGLCCNRCLDRSFIYENSKNIIILNKYRINRKIRLWENLTYPMWTVSFQMFKLVLEKAEEPEIKLPTSTGSLKKQESSRKTSISVLLTMPKPLTVWITINCGKFWKLWKYQTTWSASWETCIQARKQQLELDIDQQTGSK